MTDNSRPKRKTQTTQKSAGPAPPFSFAKRAQKVAVEAREAADEGRFLDSVLLLDELVTEFSAGDSAKYLAESLTLRSQILDEALIWGQTEQMRAYVEHMSLSSPGSVAFGSADFNGQAFLVRRVVALHSAVGYFNTFPIYEGAGNERDLDAAMTHFEFALARARSTDACGEAKSFERVFCRLFKEMGGQQLWTGRSSLTHENAVAVDCWNLARADEPRANTMWRAMAVNLSTTLADTRSRLGAHRRVDRRTSEVAASPLDAPQSAGWREKLAFRFALARESAERNPAYAVIATVALLALVVLLLMLFKVSGS